MASTSPDPSRPTLTGHSELRVLYSSIAVKSQSARHAYSAIRRTEPPRCRRTGDQPGGSVRGGLHRTRAVLDAIDRLGRRSRPAGRSRTGHPTCGCESGNRSATWPVGPPGKRPVSRPNSTAARGGSGCLSGSPGNGSCLGSRSHGEYSLDPVRVTDAGHTRARESASPGCARPEVSTIASMVGAGKGAVRLSRTPRGLEGSQLCQRSQERITLRSRSGMRTEARNGTGTCSVCKWS
jgi:hypothetical protein